MDSEVGDHTGSYYHKFLLRPEWPEGASGVTVGVGWDWGYYARQVSLSAWHTVEGSERLGPAAGLTGSAAKAFLPQVRDVVFPWDDALGVFQDLTLGQSYNEASRTFPGLQALRPNAQGALVSLIYNRGTSLTGPSRQEMRDIRDEVPREDYGAIAASLRSMKRLWSPSSGLIVRREAEAVLVLTP